MTPAEAAVTADAIQEQHRPGDEYVDPLIRRGEDLEAMRSAGLDLTPVELSELASLKIIAHAKIRHLQAFPLADTSQQESEQYRAQQEARSAHEREQWLLHAWQSLWAALGPLLLQFGESLVGAALVEVPHEVLIPGLTTLDFASVLAVVRSTVEQAASTVVADVKP
jgi:hypothetical protein